jgi:hypothetical protein
MFVWLFVVKFEKFDFENVYSKLYSGIEREEITMYLALE